MPAKYRDDWIRTSEPLAPKASALTKLSYVPKRLAHN